jgi:hypothetical protein
VEETLHVDVRWIVVEHFTSDPPEGVVVDD